MKKNLKAIGIAFAWFAVFMGIQFLVSLAGIMFILAELVHSQGLALFKDQVLFQQVYMEALLQNMTWLVLISNLVTIGGIWIFFLCRRKKFFREIGLRKTSMRNLSMSVIFGVGICFFVDMLTTYLPFPESVMDQFQSQHGMLWYGDVGLTFLSVAIVGPISEEICFRGLCYSGLKKTMRPWAAGLISSVFFGLAHGDPIWFFVGFLAGVALSWVYETTGSLLPAIVVHVTNNAISSLTAYVAFPVLLHRILLFGSIPIFLFAGFLLHRWNHRPVEIPEALPEENPFSE